jgi:hypothetical protein
LSCVLQFLTSKSLSKEKVTSTTKRCVKRSVRR